MVFIPSNMKKILWNKSLVMSAFLWFCIAAVVISQTPAPDLDSITEDSYQRMLARQAAEQKSDSLISSQTVPVITTPPRKEWEWWYVLLGVEILVVMLLVLSRDRKKPHPEDRFKK